MQTHVKNGRLDQENMPNRIAMFVNALLEAYDNTVTPTFDKSQPTYVNVSIHINNIDAVNEQTMVSALAIGFHFIFQKFSTLRLVLVVTLWSSMYSC
ncbi:hypothetical protein PoB_000422200 [Plakobranchus ocellatus]|uniref:Neurotransmitter-gated ion-channel ligand-binding domain-containing protein n=1 Tax=Plakobranchus ocellatus TaxID=259542 RepID=A0AAV3Y4S1_9GAST|nr:hypothetical protein PoB_000422200 [Plakobranchus ocellatus]